MAGLLFMFANPSFLFVLGATFSYHHPDRLNQPTDINHHHLRPRNRKDDRKDWSIYGRKGNIKLWIAGQQFPVVSYNYTSMVCAPPSFSA